MTDLYGMTGYVGISILKRHLHTIRTTAERRSQLLHLLRINKDWLCDGLNGKINNIVSLASCGFYLTEAERGVIP